MLVSHCLTIDMTVINENDQEGDAVRCKIKAI